ncbi:DNA polymerase IV [Gemmatimonadota bacterium]
MENSARPGSEELHEAPAPSDRRILLVDCDSFYVQVARLEDPDGAGREELLIVGGTPEGRGVVTSASYPTREYGVRSGMPTSQALRLCPAAVVVPVSRRACLRRSKAIRDLLTRLAPLVQAASIDEFYLDLSGTERLFRGESLEETAWRIREAVLEATGISVSVGGGTRKLVAKLAVGLAKPGGVRVVPPGGEQEFMRGMKLRDIPGVGPSFAKALERRKLFRVEDILPVEEAWLSRWFGESRGPWLWERARGLDSSKVNPDEPRKSVSSERTFAEDLQDPAALEKELLRLAVSVGRAVRRAGFQGKTVTVKIRDADFQTRQAARTLPQAVESDAAIFSQARDLLRELRTRRNMAVRLLGVGISSLEEGSDVAQTELFADEAPGEPQRQRALSRVLDDLRNRFGEDAILPGRILED